MYSESDLDAAVSAGALTAQQAGSFRDFVAASHHAPAVDEEHFRLLTGFNDIFVSIAAIILLVAVAWIGQSIAPRLDTDGPSLWAPLLVAATAWGLAEYFTRQRRMALPSILLLLAFVGGLFGTALVAMGLAIGLDNFGNDEKLGALVLSAAAAIAAGGAWLHWRRFRVPITIAAGVAALAGLVLGLIASTLGMTDSTYDVILIATLVLGIGVFFLAMRWDSSDPRRETRRSDVAFWLHLLAAPMIVHPIFTLLGLTTGTASPAEAAIVIALYVVLGLAALSIDRRALLVSALAYVLYALNELFREFGAVELSVALTALIIGSALLLLSAFWTNARRAVVRPLPESLQARLPVIDRSPVAVAAS